jgi:hypothetical protein
MKSGGQMSSQSPVVWWSREVNCEVVGMCVEASLYWVMNLWIVFIFIYYSSKPHCSVSCHFLDRFILRS